MQKLVIKFICPVINPRDQYLYPLLMESTIFMTWNEGNFDPVQEVGQTSNTMKIACYQRRNNMPPKMTKKAKETARLFHEMAVAKTWMKSLEEEYEANAKKAWKLLKGDKFIHEAGVFTKNSRTYYGVNDKNALVKKMTFKTYKEFSTISKSGIVNAIGEKGFNKMEEKGVVGVSHTTDFFVFKETKTPVDTV
jgi:hypothetical protein